MLQKIELSPTWCKEHEEMEIGHRHIAQDIPAWNGAYQISRL